MFVPYLVFLETNDCYSHLIRYQGYQEITLIKGPKMRQPLYVLTSSRTHIHTPTHHPAFLWDVYAAVILWCAQLFDTSYDRNTLIHLLPPWTQKYVIYLDISQHYMVHRLGNTVYLCWIPEVKSVSAAATVAPCYRWKVTYHISPAYVFVVERRRISHWWFLSFIFWYVLPKLFRLFWLSNIPFSAKKLAMTYSRGVVSFSGINLTNYCQYVVLIHDLKKKLTIIMKNIAPNKKVLKILSKPSWVVWSRCRSPIVTRILLPHADDTNEEIFFDESYQ